MQERLSAYCERTGNTQLLHQWHPTKNGTLTPEDLSRGSHYKAWWVCGLGHEWQAEIKSRTAGCGCPVCANREIIPGENDLASRFPAVAAQWHPTMNGSLTPDQVSAGSRQKAWWVCGKGHVWHASVSSRVGGTGCPVCAGKQIIPGENDLASHFPAVAAQWHPTKNGVLTAEDVSPYSNRKVWWVCNLGHEYVAAVAGRTMSGSGCPYCTGRKVLAGFNDLASRFPAVAAQWHPTMNGALTPEQVTVGSHKKVWWQCPEGHIWQAVVYSRAGPGKCGCPVCAGLAGPARRRPYAGVPVQARGAMPP